MLKRYIFILLLIIWIILIYISCKNSSEPQGAKGKIQGMVYNIVPDDTAMIYPAYIYIDDDLAAITDENGRYIIASLDKGIYPLKCISSSLYFKSAIDTVEITGGEIDTSDFYLERGTGVIYGEFQDVDLFNENIISFPDMEDWNSEQIYEGVTGATIIEKNLQTYVPIGEVYYGDSLFTRAKVYGQFYKTLTCGKYSLTGSLEGYINDIQEVDVFNDSIHCIIFFLSSEEEIISKLAVK
jgi:hypothetical protein